jgi:hypothetical protein
MSTKNALSIPVDAVPYRATETNVRLFENHVAANAADFIPKSYDAHFSPYRRAATDRARRFVKEVVALVQVHDGVVRPRTRARSFANARTFANQIEAVACDLAVTFLKDPACQVAISRRKDDLSGNDRYRPLVVTKSLVHVVDVMADPALDLLNYRKGVKSFREPSLNRKGTIAAGNKLRALVVAHGLTVDDFRLLHSGEVIVLKRDKEGYFDKGERVAYEDTSATKADRRRIQNLNEFIAEAAVSYILGGQCLQSVSSDRWLRRIYNNSRFDQGGRLFGGFWQGLSKVQRRDGIQIDGRPVIALDYGQSVPRILYGIAGVSPTFQDAYTLPGLEANRDGVKKVFNAMLNTRKPLTKLPRGTRDLFGKAVSVERVTALIKQVHAPISDAFCSGQGLHYMYLESEILLAVLDTLMAERIVALPVHDAVIVREDHEDRTREVMLSVFKQKTGIDGVVARDA